jgi:hypothetical protein
MRIYRERIGPIANSIVSGLIDEELIEVDAEQREEVELDVASVLTEYRRTDWQLSETARDQVSARGLDYSHTHKIKSQLAAKARFGLGDEAVEWLVGQILEILLQSRTVEEVYGEDHDIRRIVAPILKRELGVDTSLDLEVRKRIKNLEEGTEDFEIEYQKTMEKVRQAKGLGD